MKRLIMIGFFIAITAGMTGCGDNGRGSYSPQATQSETSPTENRSIDDRSQVDGLNGTTTKADDAANNSLPGNRTISGANGVDVTKDSTGEKEKSDAQ